MKREELLNILRNLYIKGELSELKRTYLLGAFLLTKEDREKIDKALIDLPGHKDVSYALKKLDGTII